MENIRKKLSANEVLSICKTDLRASDTLRLEIETKVEGWKNEYDGKPYGNEKKGKSSIVSRDIKRQDEWQHASVKDPFVSDEDIIKCTPVTYEDRLAAEQNELVLNYQFTKQFPRYKFMTDVVKLFYKEGTVVVKTSWQYEDKIEKEKVPIYGVGELGDVIELDYQEVETRKVVINRPWGEICRIGDIFIDPTAKGNIDNAQFIIHRYESDLSTLKKSGKYKNLDKVASAMPGNSSANDPEYSEEDETNFMFTDKARKKLLVYEYWGNMDMDNSGIVKPIVCAWVENTVIQLKDNPFPDKKLPFLVAANNSTPFVTHGEAMAELIGDNQKVSTAIKRGILDNMANSNNSQKGIPSGMMDPVNTRRFLNGQNFEFNGTAGNLFEGSYNSIPNSVFSVMELINQENESMTGVKSFSGGINGNSFGSTARAASGALDAVSVRRADIVRNIAENIIKPMMRKWTAYNAEFLQPEEIIRITNEEFQTIKRDDLDGSIDINIHVSTAEDNSAKAQELSFLLQTLGQTMPSDIQMLLMSQIAKLNKMPDLAKKLQEYKPEPDPYVQEMRELEKEKLIAEIQERISRASENQVDMQAKAARAMVDRARANNLNSDTDMKDLDFTRKAGGEDFAESITVKDHDRNTALIAKSKTN